MMSDPQPSQLRQIRSRMIRAERIRSARLRAESQPSLKLRILVVAIFFAPGIVFDGLGLGRYFFDETGGTIGTWLGILVGVAIIICWVMWPFTSSTHSGADLYEPPRDTTSATREGELTNADFKTLPVTATLDVES